MIVGAQHVVRRQTIEVTVRDEQQGHGIQASLGRLQESSLATVIDACCAAAERRGRVERIDRLFVDLGRIDPARLDQDVVCRLQERLPEAIVAALAAGTAPQRPGTDHPSTYSTADSGEREGRADSRHRLPSGGFVEPSNVDPAASHRRSRIQAIPADDVVSDEHGQGARPSGETGWGRVGDEVPVRRGTPEPGNRGRPMSSDPGVVASGSGESQPRASVEAADGVRPVESRSDPALSHPLEILGEFARSGTVPWWADARRPDLLTATVRQLITHDPVGLVALLGSEADGEVGLDRITRSLADPELDAIVGLIAPRAATTVAPHDLVALLVAAAGPGAPASRNRRAAAWSGLLMTALAVENSDADDLIAGSVARLARASATDVDVFVDALHSAARDAGRPVEIPRLYGEPNSPPRTSGGSSGGATEAAPIDDGRNARRDTGSLDALGLFDVSSETASERAADAPGVGEQQHAGRDTGSLDALGLFDVSSETASERAADAPGSDTVAPPGDDAAVAARPSIEGAAADTRRWSAQVPEPDLSFGDSDRVEVHSSGLVLLAPFIARLFGRLGIVERRAFVSDAASHRAVTLLHHLVTGGTDPAEYLVPLEKTLCGIAVTDVLEIADEIADSEIEACSELLDAMIEHAGILGNISLDGLRGTFLWRPGLLSFEDGTWMLRVERRTHDIVLDRLPWGFEWVVFPWMSAPMRVDW